MSWLRIDDAFPNHPKVWKAAEILGSQNRGRILAAWLDCAAYVSRYQLDGVIRKEEAERIINDRTPLKVAEALEKAGLWDRVDNVGWRFHDWGSYNQSIRATEPPPKPRRAAGARASRAGGARASRAAGSRPVPSTGEEEEEQRSPSSQPVEDGSKPTAKQVRGIENMANELGETVEVPASRAAASALFADLKARVTRQRDRAGKRRTNVVDADPGKYRDYK